MDTRPPVRQCLLLEDQPATRQWMTEVLSQAFDGSEVTAHTTVKGAFAWIDGIGEGEPGPWLAVIDIGLPDGSGIDVIRRITQRWAETRIVVSTIYGDDAHLLDAIAAGAQGYVLKEEERELIVTTLRRIERDEPPLSPSIARRMLAHFKRPEERIDDPAGLSPRETETLTLLARGLTVAEAAAQLGLTAHTVAGYVKIVYQKLGISSRAEATREAIRRGLA